MSSGFISEAEIAANKQKRQEEWEKVRQPNEPLEVQEAPYDSRSLYEKLKEQKDKKDYEYEEAHKLKNLIRGLDDDEVDFLHVIDKAKATAEHQQHMEAEAELREYREQVASIREKHQDSKIQAEIAKPKVPATKLSSRPSQKSILSGVVRKRPAASDSSAAGSSSSTASASAKSAPAQTQPKPTPSPTTKPLTTATTSPTATTATTLQPPAKKTAASIRARCIGVLPGVAPVRDSSDSDASTDTDDEYDYSGYDWLGRAIKRNKCEGGEAAGHPHQ